MSQFSPLPPTANVNNALQQALNDAIRTSNHTQGGIAERVNEAMGYTKKIVTLETVRNWQNGDEDIPTHYLTALCWAVESVEPVRVLLAPLHVTTVSNRAKTLAEAQATQTQIENAQQEQAALLQLLGGRNEQ